MSPFALHGYRTTARTSTGATPYSLVYGMEVVLPIEVQILSLRIMKDVGLNEEDWIQNRLDQLNLIDEKRLTAVVIDGNRTDCFGMLVSRNVAVSKSRHRLLCSPTRKGQKHSKIPYEICFSVREVDL